MTAVHPEDREAALKSFWEGVRSEQGFAIETRSLRAKDQTYRWHLQQAVVLRDSQGKVVISSARRPTSTIRGVRKRGSARPRKNSHALTGQRPWVSWRRRSLTNSVNRSAAP